MRICRVRNVRASLVGEGDRLVFSNPVSLTPIESPKAGERFFSGEGKRRAREYDCAFERGWRADVGPGKAVARGVRQRIPVWLCYPMEMWGVCMRREKNIRISI